MQKMIDILWRINPLLWSGDLKGGRPKWVEFGGAVCTTGPLILPGPLRHECNTPGVINRSPTSDSGKPGTGVHKISKETRTVDLFILDMLSVLDMLFRVKA